MSDKYLLAAPDSLVDNIESVLTANEIECSRVRESTVNHGRHTIDLIEFNCRSNRGVVDLATEKRRGRNGADIVLIASRRLIIWRNKNSIDLAEKIIEILCEHGADDSHDARCEKMG